MNWGDAPTWIAAVFAGGAAWFAYLTIKSQREQIREQRVFIGEQSANLMLERAELRAALEARRWAQAKRVTMTYRTGGFSDRDSTGSETGYDRWKVVVTNGSGEPVTDVMVRFGDTYNASNAVEVGEQGLPDQGRRGVPVNVVGPGRQVRFESPRWSETTVDNNRPMAWFTDAAGVTWVLDRDGALMPEEGQSGG